MVYTKRGYELYLFPQERSIKSNEKRAAKSGSLLHQQLARLLLCRFSKHGHLDVDQHVGVQRDRYCMVAYGLEQPLRQTDHRALDFESLTLERLDYVEVRDRAEQAPVDTRLLGDLDHEAFQLRALLLSRGRCDAAKAGAAGLTEIVRNKTTAEAIVEVTEF